MYYFVFVYSLHFDSVLHGLLRAKQGQDPVDVPPPLCLYTEWPKIMYTHFDMKNITL